MDKPQRFKRWGLVFAICLGLLLVFGLIKFMQIRAAIAFGESFPEPSETVEFVKVEFSDWQPEISVVGEVRASQELELRTELEGVIAKIGFDSGAEVKAGDVLLQLDIAEEQARLNAIAPEIEFARQDVKRLKGLVGRKSVSEQQAERATAQLAIAQAQAAVIRETIANKTVVAPFDGVTGLHDFEVGEYISANTHVTNLIGQLETLWIDFALPQKYTGLKPGTIVTVDASDVLASSMSAVVSAVEPSISSESRNLKARAVLDNTGREIVPGSMVKVSTPVDSSREVVRLPSTAVRIGSFGTYVFIVQQDDGQKWRAVRRPVTVAAKEGVQSIIVEGLEPGEIVASTGSFKLREGLLVNQAEAQIQQSQQGSQQHANESTRTNQIYLDEAAGQSAQAPTDQLIIDAELPVEGPASDASDTTIELEPAAPAGLEAKELE